MKKKLPAGWVETTLGAVAETSSGGTPNRKHSEFYNGSIYWVKSGELNQETLLETEEKITEAGLKNSSAKIFPKGTLLIALYGATVGKLAFLGVEAATNQAVCGIFLNEKIEKKYIYYFLYFYKDELLGKRIGTAQPNISQTIVNQIPIPLPPLAEQKRIVSEIDAVFTHVHAAQAELAKMPALIKMFRQKVLTMAVSGELTRDFRANTEISETAEALLTKIDIEKRKLVKKVKISSEIKADEKTMELPTHWSWCRLSEIAILGTGGTPSTKEKDYYENGTIAWITSSATNTPFIYESDNFITEQGLNNSNCRVYPIGTLIIAMYGQGKTRGQISELKIAAATNQACAAIQMIDAQLKPFVKIFFQRSYEEIRELSTGGVQSNLNMEKISNTIIPIPPLAEQSEIVKRVSELFTWCDAMESAYKAGVSNLKILPQSLLQRAFSGTMLPQNAGDEPASKLLERVQAAQMLPKSAKKQIKIHF